VGLAGLGRRVALRQTDFSAVWKALSSLTAWQIAVLAVLNLAILALFSTRWQLGLAALKQPVSLHRLFMYRLAGFAVNYFTPGPQVGGEPVQILLLHRREGIPAAAAFSGVYLDRLVEMLANFTFLAVGLACLAVSGLSGADISHWGWLIPAMVLIFPLSHLALLSINRQPLTQGATVLVRRIHSPRLESLARFITQMEDHLGQLLRYSPLSLVKMLLLSAFTWGMVVLEFGLLFTFVQAQVTILQVIVVLTLLRLAILLPIPAGLGALEAGLMWGARLVGVDPAVGIAAAIIIRARDLLIGGIGLWLGSWLLYKKSDD
jgi:uncharacterized protein (TIRG00374 family)